MDTGKSGSIDETVPFFPIVIALKDGIEHRVVPDSLKRQGKYSKDVRLILNVQSKPWKNIDLLLRPHGYKPMFTGSNNNYITDEVTVWQDNDWENPILHQHKASVHIHGKVASPNNMALKKITELPVVGLWSYISYQGQAILTRHVLITTADKDRIQDNIFKYKNFKITDFNGFFSCIAPDTVSTFIKKHESL